MLLGFAVTWRHPHRKSLEVWDTWGTDGLAQVAELVANNCTLNPNDGAPGDAYTSPLRVLSSDSLQVALVGRGFDATNATANDMLFLTSSDNVTRQADEVYGTVVRSTPTQLGVKRWLSG